MTIAERVDEHIRLYYKMYGQGASYLYVGHTEFLQISKAAGYARNHSLMDRYMNLVIITVNLECHLRVAGEY